MHEVQYAVRTLRRAPGFTAVVVLTLALAIGATTAVFSVVYGVLLRPLPYQAPEHLVTVTHFYPSYKNLEATVSYPGFVTYRDQAKSFSPVAVGANWRPNLTGEGNPEQLSGALVSGQFFATTGVAAALGRTLRPDEDAPGHERVVVLSHAFWQSHFGGDAAVVGKSIRLNGENHDVVGVMPPRFKDPFLSNAQLWRPLALSPTTAAQGSEWLNLIARLKPGVTVEQAQAEMSTMAESIKQQAPDRYPADWSLHVSGLQERGTRPVRSMLLLLLGAVGFVLLIGCANVANLVLARNAAREREVSIRLALGAKRAHLVRQLLVESLVLAVAAGSLGVLLADFALGALAGLSPSSFGADQVGLDPTVLRFALVISLGTGLLVGLLPALQLSGPEIQTRLRDGGRGLAGGRHAHSMRRTLVVAEVALALVLLSGAGLFIQSFIRLQAVDPGFEPDGLLTLTLALPASKYQTDAQRVAFFDAVLPRIAALPGVEAVGGTTSLPFGRGNWTSSFVVEGFQPGPNQPDPWGDFRSVSPGLDRALGVPLLRGRWVTDADDSTARRVVVVDDELAERYWPGADPIGKRIAFGVAQGQEPQWMEVVGVIGHLKHEGLDAEPRVQYYTPYRQVSVSQLSLAIRTSGDPIHALPAVREAVQSVDRDQPVSNVQTMDELLSASVGPRRLSMLLLTGFAGLSLLLACLGIYGVMAYSVAMRTRELGVRMALGAAPGSVLRLILRQGMTLTLIGIGIGLAGVLGLTRVIQSQLYLVKASDPATLAVVVALFIAVTLLATVVPARRATQVDPAVALRGD